MILIRLLYLFLFWSIDILIYLKLYKDKTKWNNALIGVIWLFALLAHLLIPKHLYLMKVKDFITMSGIAVQMIVISYIGIYSVKRIERFALLDDVKQPAVKFWSFNFRYVIFAVFLFAHFIWAISVEL